jgi:hypothetical protein
VVAGDREDRPVVLTKRLVELVVVVLVLAELVDDVAEVEEERGDDTGVPRRGQVGRHHVRHPGLVGQREARGRGVLGRTGVADGVEGDPRAAGDRIEHRGRQHAGQLDVRRRAARRRERLQVVLVLLVVGRVVVLLAGVVDLERRLVGRRGRVGEQPASGVVGERRGL